MSWSNLTPIHYCTYVHLSARPCILEIKVEDADINRSPWNFAQSLDTVGMDKIGWDFDIAPLYMCIIRYGVLLLYMTYFGTNRFRL